MKTTMTLRAVILGLFLAATSTTLGIAANARSLSRPLGRRRGRPGDAGGHRRGLRELATIAPHGLLAVAL